MKQQQWKYLFNFMHLERFSQSKTKSRTVYKLGC